MPAIAATPGPEKLAKQGLVLREQRVGRGHPATDETQPARVRELTEHLALLRSRLSVHAGKGRMALGRRIDQIGSPAASGWYVTATTRSRRERAFGTGQSIESPTERPSSALPIGASTEI